VGNRDLDRDPRGIHQGHEPLRALQALASLEPPDADAGEVARAIAAVVDASLGTRPFRVYIDPSQDGAEEVFRVGDRIRREMFRYMGLQDLLTPRVRG